MEYIISAIISLFTTVAFMLFSETFTTSKSEFSLFKRYIILYLLFALPQLFFTSTLGHQLEFLEVPFNLIAFSVCMVIMYNIKLKHSLLVMSAFNILVFTLDFISLSILSAVLGATILEIIYSVTLFCITATFSQFVTVTVCFLINKFFRAKRKEITISPSQWLQIFIYISFCSLSIYFISTNAFNTGTNSFSHVIYSLLAILLTFVMFALTTKLSEENETKQQNALLAQQLKLGMENIESLNSAYSQQRRLTHDFNNHLSVIYSLLNSGDVAKATDYTNQLLNTSISVSRLFDSGNRIVDTLLTQKYNQAKDAGIKMQVLVEDLSDVAMSADKLVVVLSNLLDNAIEAASAVTDGKIIKVKFTQENGGHMLTVQNTAVKGPAVENNRIISTKADKLNHGYGMKNIYSVLDSYGYPYTSGFDNGVYTFTAMMID